MPWVRADLAECYARLEAMKLLNWQMVEAIAADRLQPGRRVGGEGLRHRDPRRSSTASCSAILGAAAGCGPGSPGAVLRGEVERAARSAQINTFGGGVNEVQREIVAAAGLGMARRAR